MKVLGLKETYETPRKTPADLTRVPDVNWNEDMASSRFTLPCIDKSYAQVRKAFIIPGGKITSSPEITNPRNKGEKVASA